jgi:hypothetical protein
VESFLLIFGAIVVAWPSAIDLSFSCFFWSLFPCVLGFLVTTVLTTSTSRIEFDFDGIDEEDSRYPEVRASVSNIDDPDMPAMTLRMWLVGLLLCMTSRFVRFGRFFFLLSYITLHHCSALNVF